MTISTLIQVRTIGKWSKTWGYNNCQLWSNNYILYQEVPSIEDDHSGKSETSRQVKGRSKELDPIWSIHGPNKVPIIEHAMEM